VTSCVPDVTQQSCYDGPAATRDVGACKSGTQSCVSTLGSCTGQVLPATIESCFNDIDDDCDGRVNNGCPDTLTVGTAHPLTARGGNGGSPAMAMCPVGSIVTDTVMWWDDMDGWIGGLDIYCSTVTLVRGATSYSVTVTPLSTQPSASVHGNHAGKSGSFGAGGTKNDPCNTSTFNVGQWIGGTAATSTSSLVSGFKMNCSTGMLTLGANNQLTLSFVKDSTMNAPDGYAHMDPLFEDDCGSNEVLVGYNARAGDSLDQVQAVCAPLQVSYK
jgi:hypothetical protein